MRNENLGAPLFRSPFFLFFRFVIDLVKKLISDNKSRFEKLVFFWWNTDLTGQKLIFFKNYRFDQRAFRQSVTLRFHNNISMAKVQNYPSPFVTMQTSCHTLFFHRKIDVIFWELHWCFFYVSKIFRMNSELQAKIQEEQKFWDTTMEIRDFILWPSIGRRQIVKSGLRSGKPQATISEFPHWKPAASIPVRIIIK